MIFLSQAICLVLISLTTFTKADKDAGGQQLTAQRFEGDGCDQLIPSFIKQIIENEGDCDEAGDFPTPGECTIYFKCIRGRGRILPFLQYCAVGYAFIEDSCVPNKNSSDCPQFNCHPVKTVAEASQAPASSELDSYDKGESKEIQKSSSDTTMETNHNDDSLLNTAKISSKTEIPLHHISGTSVQVISSKTEAEPTNSEEATAAQKSSSSKMLFEHFVVMPFIVASIWV